MVTRVNKSNRPHIKAFTRAWLSEASKKKSGPGVGKISLIDIWDAETAMQEEFGISDYMSQVISWAVIKEQNG